MNNLGKKGEDRITGFEGTIVGVVHYLTGCSQYLLQPKAKNGDFKDAKWFDEGRISFGEQVINPSDIKAEKDGCDLAAPIK